MKERSSTYDIRKTTLGYQEEVERLKVQAMMGWHKEFRNLQWYGLQNGMSVLELGSGPGFVTEQLANNLPDSEITALEIDSSLLDEARHRLHYIPSSRLHFVQESVYDTGLPDNSYDFAVARLLFLHLHNPVKAAQEIYRILKPGGKLVIIDIDDGIFGAIYPDLMLLPSVLRKLADYQALDIDTVTQHSDLHGVEGFKRQFDIKRFKVFYQKGIINIEEFEQLKQASENINNSPEAYAMMNFVMAYGKKPAHDSSYCNKEMQ